MPPFYRFLFARDDLRARADWGRGTLAPLRRDSFNAMAIACFRLVTLRPEPLVSVPLLRRRIADSTFFDAALPYFAIPPPRDLTGRDPGIDDVTPEA